MTIRARSVLALIATAGVLVTACAAPPSATTSPGQAAPAAPAAPKRASVVVRSDVPTLLPSAAGAIPGLPELNLMLTVPLVIGDPLQTKVAETVPSTTNGLWQVFADGRMQTTFKLRKDVRWQDGQPVTADDFVFKSVLEQDPKMVFGATAAYAYVEKIEAPDLYTFVITWKRPYLKADAGLVGAPMPKHILDPVYQSGNLERFQSLAHWTTDYIGNGPYRVKGWTVGSGAVLEANSDYFLGKPKIDTIDVRFIIDPNTIGANILAGEVDVTLGGRLALDWAQSLRDQGQGKVTMGASPANPLVIYIAFTNQNPPAMREVNLRRALLHAMDRQTMMEGLVGGQTSIAHAVTLNPNRPEEYAAAKGSIVEYAHDPRISAQLAEGLSMRKEADGYYLDPTGQPMTFEIRTTQGDTQQERASYSTADNWQKAGFKTDVTIVPSARRGDNEYRLTFQGFDLRRQGIDDPLDKLHSSQFPRADDNWRGGNYGRYSHPEMDRLAESWSVAIPLKERFELLSAITRHITDQVVYMGTFYDVELTVWTSRMKNVITRSGGNGETLNVHEWDV